MLLGMFSPRRSIPKSVDGFGFGLIVECVQHTHSYSTEHRRI